MKDLYSKTKTSNSAFNFKELTQFTNFELKRKIKRGLLKLIKVRKNKKQNMKKLISIFKQKSKLIKIQNQSNFKDFFVKILQNKYCLILSDLVIIANAVILSLDSYLKSDTFIFHLEIIDFLFFLFYAFYLISRIFVFGFKIFFSNFIHYMEFIIVLSNCILFLYEILFQINIFNNEFILDKFVKSLKVFMLLKIFYEGRNFHSFSILIRSTVQTLKEMIYFIILIGFVIISIALIGKEIFAYEIAYDQNGNFSNK